MKELMDIKDTLTAVIAVTASVGIISGIVLLLWWVAYMRYTYSPPPHGSSFYILSMLNIDAIHILLGMCIAFIGVSVSAYIGLCLIETDEKVIK